MKVWVLYQRCGTVGENTLGVYTTRERAERELRDATAPYQRPGWDDCFLEEMEADEKPIRLRVPADGAVAA